MLLFFVVWSVAVSCGDAYVGFNFALMQQKVPLTPLVAAQKFRAAFPKVSHVKLFDYNRDYLVALHQVGITDVVINIPNVELVAIAGSLQKAEDVVDILSPFVSAGMKFTIAVGNEPLAPWYSGSFQPHLLPALHNLLNVLQAKKMRSSVQLTVPFSFSVLSSTYPPSTGAFISSLKDTMLSVAHLLANISSPFFVNIYPFSAYRSSPLDVPLPYALLETGHTVEGVTYPHLLAAQVAALRFALLQLDKGLTNAVLPIVIGETGWPTSGHPAATVGRAETFVTNAVRFSDEQSLYLFEAFDELRKSQDAGGGAVGDGVENHWGVLLEDGTPKFEVPALAASASPSPLTKVKIHHHAESSSATSQGFGGSIVVVFGCIIALIAAALWQKRTRAGYGQL